MRVCVCEREKERACMFVRTVCMWHVHARVPVYDFTAIVGSTKPGHAVQDEHYPPPTVPQTGRNC